MKAQEKQNKVENQDKTEKQDKTKKQVKADKSIIKPDKAGQNSKSRKQKRKAPKETTF